ncbi:N-acetylmuramoyl-L-alanine amidase [Phaeobacter phage MD18]|nr:N-acetylmuramoyl-L-alanine amidase [Phaeobacter phage MD18]
MQIENHRLRGAVNAPSPNHGGVIVPRFVVMHYTAGWSAGSAIETFSRRSSKVSAQVTIDTDGRIYQHVPFNVKAWHAGPSTYAGYSGLNNHSIGIELVNPGYLRKLEDGSYMDAYDRRHSAQDVGPVVASKHRRVGSGTFYWPAYTKAQIEAAEALTAELIDAYDIIDIVSHEEIDTRGWKTDPGPAFPMNRFKRLLGDRGNDVVNYEVTASSLNVRYGPGTDFNIASRLSRGAVVTEEYRTGDWVRISSDHWVHGGFLRRMM